MFNELVDQEKYPFKSRRKKKPKKPKGQFVKSREGKRNGVELERLRSPTDFSVSFPYVGDYCLLLVLNSSVDK